MWIFRINLDRFSGTKSAMEDEVLDTPLLASILYTVGKICDEEGDNIYSLDSHRNSEVIAIVSARVCII